MPISTETRTWAGIGQRLGAQQMPEPPAKKREYIVVCRATGKSLVLTIPAPIRKALSLYEGAPLYLRIQGKLLTLERVDTLRTSQIDVLKAIHPRAKVPWKKRLRLLGQHNPHEQYELQGLPVNLEKPL